MLAYWREWDAERLLVLNNLAPEPVTVAVPLPAGETRTAVDLLTGETFAPSADGLLHLSLAGYVYRWLQF